MRFKKTKNFASGSTMTFPDGWGLIRASNTQPVLVMRFEARTEKRLAEIRAIVESLVQTANEMQKNNNSLEARLNASRQEISQLQQNLEVVRSESLTDPRPRRSTRRSTSDCDAAAMARGPITPTMRGGSPAPRDMPRVFPEPGTVAHVALASQMVTPQLSNCAIP